MIKQFKEARIALLTPLHERLEKIITSDKVDLADSRVDSAMNWWNERAEYVQEQIGDTGNPLGPYNDAHFEWTQLVWQEIRTWASLGEVVSSTEFDELCSHRSFNKQQVNFLLDFLQDTNLADLTLRHRRNWRSFGQ